MKNATFIFYLKKKKNKYSNAKLIRICESPAFFYEYYEFGKNLKFHSMYHFVAKYIMFELNILYICKYKTLIAAIKKIKCYIQSV